MSRDSLLLSAAAGDAPRMRSISMSGEQDWPPDWLHTTRTGGAGAKRWVNELESRVVFVCLLWTWFAGAELSCVCFVVDSEDLEQPSAHHCCGCFTHRLLPPRCSLLAARSNVKLTFDISIRHRCASLNLCSGHQPLATDARGCHLPEYGTSVVETCHQFWISWDFTIL